MRPLILIMTLLGTIALAAPRGADVLRTFDADPVGQPPAEFGFATTRDAAPRRWFVQRDAQTQSVGHVLTHSGDPASGRGFAVALLERPQLRELSISVRVRLLGAGRGAGLVWRYQDPGNYYLAQIRLTDHSVSVYRMVDGNRVRLEDESDLELDPAEWHTLRVVQRRQSARVYMRGIRVFELRDRTGPGAGAVGVWCRGDSVAEFDDLRVERRDE